jgi:Stage II sporulation protein E (SpoIIE)
VARQPELVKPSASLAGLQELTAPALLAMAGAGLIAVLDGVGSAMVLRKRSRVDQLGEPGTLLGALPTPSLADVDARLGAGDSLILYTDGVLDLGDRSEGDDPGWLARQLESAAGGSADELTSKLAEAAVRRNAANPGTKSPSSSSAGAAPASVHRLPSPAPG